MPSSFPGTYVTRAEATDADDPETDNAALRYSILEQGSPQLFSIDEHTGEIRTVQVGLDREVRRHRAVLKAGSREASVLFDQSLPTLLVLWGARGAHFELGPLTQCRSARLALPCR